jgi:hypothetical protein
VDAHKLSLKEKTRGLGTRPERGQSDVPAHGPAQVDRGLPARLSTPWSASPAAGSGTTVTHRLRASLVHSNLASAEVLAIQGIDRGAGAFIRLHLNEGKTASPTGHLVANDVHRVHWRNRLKQIFELTLVGAEREISNE